MEAGDPTPAPVSPTGEERSNGVRPEALRRLLARRPYLMAFLVSMVRDFPLAESIYHDLCVTACERWEEIQEGGTFEAWICEMARRRALAELRARAQDGSALPPERLVNEMERVIAEWAATPRERWERHKQALRACLKQLPVHLRELIDQRYVQDQSIEEIAQRLGRPARAVGEALGRARAELEACLRRRLESEGASA